MKLLIVDASDNRLGEIKLSQELLRRPEILVQRVERAIAAGIRERACPSNENDRIVENVTRGTLEGLDSDDSIMDVPLRLSEACKFDFEKHVSAIAEREAEVATDRVRFTKLNYAQENSKRFDERYKERPLNRIRFK